MIVENAYKILKFKRKQQLSIVHYKLTQQLEASNKEPVRKKMYGHTNKHSASNNNVRYESKKGNMGQYKQKSNYRKQGRYEDDEKDERFQGGYQKRVYGKNQSFGTNSKHQSDNTAVKVNIGKKTSKQVVNYFIEFKNRDIELGTTWKEILQSIDRHFPQSDMILNLAVKINVWDVLKTSSSLIIPNQDVEEILILYGKYKSQHY